MGRLLMEKQPLINITTAAAIDRVVHHATILELNGSSYQNDVVNKLIQ